VALLLPLMALGRWTKSSTKCKTSWEFALPSALNNLFKAILHGEVTLMLAGVRFCAGGSRVAP